MPDPTTIGAADEPRAAVASIHVEFVYALPQRQARVRLALPAGTTLGQALEVSGILQQHPEIDLEKNKLGIYGRLAKPDTTLRDHDRVEIYRPLIADSKEARKRRAAAKVEAKSE